MRIIPLDSKLQLDLKIDGTSNGDGFMSAALEKAIQEEVRRLTDEQQRQVLAFIESLKPGTRHRSGERFSFIGIGRSGHNSPSNAGDSEEDNQLAQAAAALLEDYQTDPELTAFTSLDGQGGNRR